jgi:Flp pilus assembly protein TadG
LPHPRVLSRRALSRGGATLELALLSPWVFLLFIGALDWGFYGYSLISLQAATRSAILYTSTSSTTATNSTMACTIVLGELRKLSNIGTSTTTCGTNPVVTATSITGPDSAAAAQISVQYQTPALIPIPGLLAKQFTITRIAKMRIRS